MLKRSQSAPESEPGMRRHLRWVSILIIGLPGVILVTGAFYSLLGLQGGRYGQAIFLSMVYGLLLWMLFRLARCEFMPAVCVWMTLALGATGPLVIGHAMGYGDMQSLAYLDVQQDTSGRFPAAWKELPREEVFPKWVGSLTGQEGGGFLGYLRAQSAIGWEGTVGIKYRMYVVRKGVWVWLAWFWHLTFFLIAATTAFFVARKPTIAAACTSTELAVGVPNSATQDGERGRGPADLAVATAWSDYNDQQRIMVSYRYEPYEGFPTLRDFFAAGMRQRLPRGDDEKYAGSDLSNFMERVCVMRDLTRSELIQFIATHSGPTMVSNVPSVPINLKSAIICRDELSVKLVIWQTDRGYWEMVWSTANTY